MRTGFRPPGVVVVAVVAAAATVLATGWLQHGHSPDGRPQGSAHVAAAPVQEVPAATVRSSPPVGHPGAGAFRLTVDTSQGRFDAAVAPLRATLRPDGTAEPIDPPHHTAKQWDTAAWIEQSAYPASPVSGPSYIYGHACHYHVCSFTRLTHVAVGDTITVRTAPQTLTYRVCGRGLSPKAVNLIVPACDQSDADLVLVTCQYEHGDTSVDNLVVAATLVAETPSAQS